MKRYANIKEVSEYTSLPVKTLYEWASLGRIPSIKLGRRVIKKSLKRLLPMYAKAYIILDTVQRTPSGHGKGGVNV
ncbi:helix-turn-helix domain-containing protein [Candidatus Brocadia sp. AMX2]|uniref:helix-turn-helix domain-containing protein n=1 Tax=Candidatus Brocadia sp. AMX2 TaxID=2293635 RepID=UPI00255E5138|nr:helix-turn-helix domain-containing protein [Candidatus Brocadia sp. AMX2]